MSPVLVLVVRFTLVVLTFVLRKGEKIYEPLPESATIHEPFLLLVPPIFVFLLMYLAVDGSDPLALMSVYLPPKQRS